MNDTVDGKTPIEHAAERLLRARFVCVLTGAGVSAESGVPTFRDAQTGLWARYDPETLASPQGFAANPGLVWRWYMARFGGVREARPNDGHHALARLETWLADREDPARFLLFTQNVDDLHERAGSRAVHHLHGSIAEYRCSLCAHDHVLKEEEREAPEPPACSRCGGCVRPGVVWFGEDLPRDIVEIAWRAAETCDVLLVVGTSGQVYPVARLPFVAREAGASVIDVNPDPGPISRIADLFLQGPSGMIVPRVLELAQSMSE